MGNIIAYISLGVGGYNMKKRCLSFIVTAACLVGFILLSVVFFFVENQCGNELQMSSVVDAFWCSIASFFAIGYGDIIILSFWGKILYIGFILLGICFLGVIIGKVAGLFMEQFEKRKLGYMGTSFKNHIIIIGWDSFAEDVVLQLVNADRKVAVMTDKKDDIDLIYQRFDRKKVFVGFSDLSNYNSLETLNAQDAKTIFLNNGNDSDKLISILNIRKICTKSEFVVLLDSRELKETFKSAGVRYVLSKNEVASRILASYIFEPAVADFTCDLITSAGHDDESDYDIQQYEVVKDNPFLGKSYGDLFKNLKEEHNIIAIGLNKQGKDGRGLLKVPNDFETIEVGDDVIVIANGDTEIIMQRIFKTNEGIQ